jgi:hypothetical protein
MAKKGEYGEAIYKGGYDVIKDNARALKQTGQGLHPSVLTASEKKILADHAKKKASAPTPKRTTSDGYMPRKSEVVKSAKKELYKMGKENVGKEKAVEGMKKAFKKHKE